MAIVGEATIKLNYDGKSGQASLKSAINDSEKTLSDAQKKLVENGAKLVTGAFVGAATAISGLAANSVKQFAEFEQVSGGIQKIFNDMDYDSIAKDAKQAYKTMNISATEYMKQISGVGATFAQTMGDEKGYKTAKQGMQALADYASGTGKEVGLLMEKYQAITRSTSSYLSIADQFAGILPQTTDGFVKQAQASGYLSKEYTKLSQVPVAEYQQAISKMLEDGVKDMGLLGNTAAETEGTISGSFNAMKAAWQNTVTSFVSGGDDLDDNLNDLAKTITDLARNVIPKFLSAFSNIYSKIFERAPVVTTFVTVLGGLAVAIWAINTATTAWTAATTALNTILAISKVTILGHPIFLVAAVIAGIIAALVLLVTHINEVGQWFMNLGAAINTFFGDFSAKALEVIDGFAQGFWKAIEAVKSWFAGIPGFFAGVIDRILGGFKAFGTKVGEVVGGAFKAVVNGVLGFVENFINAPIRAINGLIDTINSVPGIDLGRLDEFHLPRLAKGGLATGSTLANIGEAGAEAVIPLERNPDSWAAPLARAIADQFTEQGIGGAGITVYMTNNINSDLDADEIGQRLMTSIRRAA